MNVNTIQELKSDIVWKFMNRAKWFLDGAKVIYKLENRFYGFWVVSYYLLSHSIELAIKAHEILKKDFSANGHDLAEIAQRNTLSLNLSADELNVIAELSALNSGPGGLRYPNDNQEGFYADCFKKGCELSQRILNEVLSELESSK